MSLVPELTRPMCSAMSFGLLPAALIIDGDAMSVGMVQRVVMVE
jgi:hypothetical protein